MIMQTDGLYCFVVIDLKENKHIIFVLEIFLMNILKFYLIFHLSIMYDLSHQFFKLTLLLVAIDVYCNVYFVE